MLNFFSNELFYMFFMLGKSGFNSNGVMIGRFVGVEFDFFDEEYGK